MVDEMERNVNIYNICNIYEDVYEYEYEYVIHTRTCHMWR